MSVLREKFDNNDVISIIRNIKVKSKPKLFLSQCESKLSVDIKKRIQVTACNCENGNKKAFDVIDQDMKLKNNDETVLQDLFKSTLHFENSEDILSIHDECESKVLENSKNESLPVLQNLDFSNNQNLKNVNLNGRKIDLTINFNDSNKCGINVGCKDICNKVNADDDEGVNQDLDSKPTMNVDLKDNLFSSTDDSDYENFIKSRKKVTSKRRDDLSDFIKDSSSDGESEVDNDLAFYYRINNEWHDSEIQKKNNIFSDSDESDWVSTSSSSLSSPEQRPVFEPEKSLEFNYKTPTRFYLNKNVSTVKSTKSISNQIPRIAEFVYSLFPIDTVKPNIIRHPDAEIFVRKFKSKRKELSAYLFKLLNEKVFKNKLPQDLDISWNKRLLKTAGLCKYLYRTTTLNDGTSNRTRSAQILLSEKVCTSAERVRDTLLHETCHAAVWIVNGTNDGHGRLWKFWVRQVHNVWPQLPMITVCHAYNIETRFTYRCTGCGSRINRHTKSLDLDKKVCGNCRSRFELFINTPKGKMLTPHVAASMDKRLKAHCTPKQSTTKGRPTFGGSRGDKASTSDMIPPPSVLDLEKELNHLQIDTNES